jgi:hypothetical protein
MGANVYLENVKSFGYNTAASATAITQDIDGISGKRIAIRAFGATASESADSVYFMRVGSRTTASAAVASGLTTVVCSAALTDPAGNAIAASDVIALKMDDGTLHWTTVASWAATTLTVVVNDAIDDTMAAGNEIYCLGVYSDSGHMRFKLTASTQSVKEIDGGIFYADAKGDPMRVHHANAGSVPGSIDYLTVDYINK